MPVKREKSKVDTTLRQRIRELKEKNFNNLTQSDIKDLVIILAKKFNLIK